MSFVDTVVVVVEFVVFVAVDGIPVIVASLLECDPEDKDESTPSNTLHLYTFLSTSNFVSNNTLFSSLLLSFHPISGTGRTVTADAAPASTVDVDDESSNISGTFPEDVAVAFPTPAAPASEWRSVLRRINPGAGNRVNGNDATLTCSFIYVSTPNTALAIVALIIELNAAGIEPA